MMLFKDRGYRRGTRAALALTALAMLTLAGPLTTLADGSYGGGGKVGGDYDYEYDSGPYPAYYDEYVYNYATSKDGKGYYSWYDGEWSDWYGWDDQPADYQWKPSAAEYDGKQYVVYNGKDGKYYYNGYDGEAWDGWQPVAGDYDYQYAPYLNYYDGYLYLYGVASDGYVYYSSYDGSWSDWAPVNDDYTAGWYQPYALDWDGYENVWWTGDDGKIYWNRYDGEEWVGAKQLPYKGDEYEYADSPYAIGYSEDGKLYAYANTTDGYPTWNVFDGEGWSGWQEYKAKVPAKTKYQPNAYEYDGVQHLIVTGDDGHAYYTTYDGAYGEWADLGDNYDYDPYQYEYDGGLYLTYTGTNGYVYYKEYEEKDNGY